MLSVTLMTAVVLLSQLKMGVAGEDCLELLVPAYANPCCGGGPDMWSTLISTAIMNEVKVNIILNPFNGPGLHTTIDPNYLNLNTGSVGGPLLDFYSNGGIIYGYVATSFADRSLSEVKDDIDKYHASSYYYDGNILLNGGIFLDEMSNNLDDVPYYQDIKAYIDSNYPNSKVISNPGTSFTNPGASTVNDYAQVADTIVTFEDIGDNYINAYTPPAWLADYSQDQFAHLVHSTDSFFPDMTTAVGLACERKAGMIYFTDDSIVDFNPWDSLTTYWPSLVNAVAAASSCCILTVSVDVQPGEGVGCLNINGNGKIPVAIHGAPNLNVADIDPSTLEFNGLIVRVKKNNNLQCSSNEDINEDSYPDLVCQFEDNPALWAVVDSDTATVTGNLFDGTPIIGTDEICIIY